MFQIFKKNKNTDRKKQFKDPVCGMTASDGVTLEYNGQTYGFCSEHCKKQFENNPEAYAAK